MLKNINTKQRGFTLVELLIVIVVIAILAAISIIAYNGITNRGKASSAQSLASQISKKAESWNTIQSGYPTYCNFVSSETNTSGSPTGVGKAGCTSNASPVAGPSEAKIDDPSKVRTNATADESAVQYQLCNTGKGAKVLWAGGGQTGTITLGDTTAGTCSATGS